MNPNDSVHRDFFSLRATTKFIPMDDRDVILQIKGNDGYKCWVNQKLVLDRSEKVSYHEDILTLNLDKGVPITMELEYFESFGNPDLHVNVLKEKAAYKNKSLIEVAENVDYIIVFAGIEEGEFQDRSRLDLEEKVEDVMLALSTTGKPIVVSLIGGSAITMEKWKDRVSAIWMNWYGGEQQGIAFANLLSGKTDPSGRLPITFPICEGQLPLSYWHEPTGRGEDYVDGTGLPLFPFGYGLSYANFQWSDLKWDNRESGTLSLTVKNTSDRPGFEVVQLYMQNQVNPALQPVIRLVGIEKLYLKPSEEKEVKFLVSHVKDFLALSDSEAMLGNYQWAVGRSSRNLVSKCSGNFSTK
jgi:beta-glucosidase